MPRSPLSLILATLAVLATLLVAGPARAAEYAGPVEDYPSYEPATRCKPRPKPGTEAFARWTVRRFGGGYGGISRGCGATTSEHTEGRAFDWSVSVRSRADRRRVAELLAALFASDEAGNPDALARRMGVMYVIWDDRIYSAWRGYEPVAYLNGACATRKRCSASLRHRNHVHVSLTRDAARGASSWYAGRV